MSREFWIQFMVNTDAIAYTKPFDDTIHVIEFSAVTDLKAKLERAEAEIERLKSIGKELHTQRGFYVTKYTNSEKRITALRKYIADGDCDCAGENGNDDGHYQERLCFRCEALSADDKLNVEESK